jgi:hypothetical protein
MPCRAAARGAGPADRRRARPALLGALVALLAAPALLVPALLLPMLLLGAAPANAHPFGPPPSALLRAEAELLLIDWRAAPDDTAAIGVELGYMEEAVLDAYLEAPTQVAPSAADEDALAASPQLHAYLVERVVVRQDGTPCEAAALDTADFVHAGARLAYRCPEPIAAVELEITLLHDVHEAYRTFGIAESEATVPAQAVFSVATPRHTMDFSGAGAAGDAGTGADGAPGGDGGGLSGVTALAGVLVIGLLGGIVVAGRGRR